MTSVQKAPVPLCPHWHPCWRPSGNLIFVFHLTGLAYLVLTAAACCPCISPSPSLWNLLLLACCHLARGIPLVSTVTFLLFPHTMHPLGPSQPIVHCYKLYSSRMACPQTCPVPVHLRASTSAPLPTEMFIVLLPLTSCSALNLHLLFLLPYRPQSCPAASVPKTPLDLVLTYLF